MRKDRPNSAGNGVAILVNNSIKYKRVTQLYECEGKLDAMYSGGVVTRGAGYSGATVSSGATDFSSGVDFVFLT